MISTTTNPKGPRAMFRRYIILGGLTAATLIGGGANVASAQPTHTTVIPVLGPVLDQARSYGHLVQPEPTTTTVPEATTPETIPIPLTPAPECVGYHTSVTSNQLWWDQDPDGGYLAENGQTYRYTDVPTDGCEYTPCTDYSVSPAQDRVAVQCPWVSDYTKVPAPVIP